MYRDVTCLKPPGVTYPEAGPGDFPSRRIGPWKNCHVCPNIIHPNLDFCYEIFVERKSAPRYFRELLLDNKWNHSALFGRNGGLSYFSGQELLLHHRVKWPWRRVNQLTRTPNYRLWNWRPEKETKIQLGRATIIAGVRPECVWYSDWWSLRSAHQSIPW